MNVVLIPRWRLTMSRAWDRFQVPLPFSRIDAYFATPIHPEEGEKTEALRKRVEASLVELEQQHDPREAQATCKTVE